jgi:peroxiredoxin
MPLPYRFPKYFLTTLPLLVLFILLTTAPQAQAEQQKMPAFLLEAVNNSGAINSEEYIGKVLIINFWATWCPVCRRETKDFIELSKTYKDQDFQIIGISMDKSSEKRVLAFMQKMKINYPIAMATKKVITEFGPIVGIPASFLIDKKGNIFKKRQGYMKYKQLVTDIEQLLAE